MKPLSKHERYLFSLTDSVATSVKAQRAAIARAGLTGKTRSEIHKIRLKNWRELRANKPDVPVFVLAAQQAYRSWDRQAPSLSMQGVVCDCRGLSILAHDSIDWGRIRKRSRGDATARGFHVREEDNGKTGWNRVVDRYVDYGCVKSPDDKKIAIQVDNTGWHIKPMFRRKFFFRDVLYQLDGSVLPSKMSPRQNLRAIARTLQRHGWDAYLTYQSDEEVSAGSGERHRKGKNFVCVVNMGQYGYYHHSLTHAVSCRNALTAINEALKQRRDTKRKQEFDAAIAAGKEVFVGIDDSVKGGNCAPGTASFAEQLCKSLGLDPAGTGGVLSSVLLAFRDDVYTRRAVYAAMMRRG